MNKYKNIKTFKKLPYFDSNYSKKALKRLRVSADLSTIMLTILTTFSIASLSCCVHAFANKFSSCGGTKNGIQERASLISLSLRKPPIFPLVFRAPSVFMKKITF